MADDLSTTSHAPEADVAGWIRSPFTAAGSTYDCFEKGSGPGVVLIPEVPGMTPEVLGFAEHLVDSGFTVVIPSPFGQPGRPATTGYTIGVVMRLCVSAEFRAFAINAHRPISDYLHALARNLAARTPGPGVGVIGMCFSGGFALAAAVDDSVLASVVSQPAVPLPLTRKMRADPGVSDSELSRISERTAAGELCVLGLRFSEDASVPRARFRSIRARLGDAFEVIELDSSPGNPGGFSPRAHSVLTHELRETPGHPALLAREQVVAFLRKRLDA